MSLGVVRERTVCLRSDGGDMCATRHVSLDMDSPLRGSHSPDPSSSHAMRREELTADEPMTQQ